MPRDHRPPATSRHIRTVSLQRLDEGGEYLGAAPSISAERDHHPDLGRRELDAQSTGEQPSSALVASVDQVRNRGSAHRID